MPETTTPIPAPANQLEKKEPVIHVIPDEFYGVASRARLPAMAAPGRAGAAAPAGARPPAAAKGGESKAWLLVPVIALVVILILGFLAWYFILRKPSAASAPVSKPSVTIVPPTTPDETAPPEEVATSTAPTPPPDAATSTPPILTETATSTAPTADATGTPSLAGARDADNDGLSDVEEALYGTDQNKSDSDADGYSDSVEVINLYNPAGFKPTTLLEAGLATPYDSKDGHYEVLYPTNWTAIDKGNGDSVFADTHNQPIAISVEDNPDGKSVLDWYLNANPQVSPSQVQPFYTKFGIEGVRGPDSQVSYVSGNGKIYIITYAPGLQTEAYFRATYLMMVNSFKLKP